MFDKCEQCDRCERVYALLRQCVRPGSPGLPQSHIRSQAALMCECVYVPLNSMHFRLLLHPAPRFSPSPSSHAAPGLYIAASSRAEPQHARSMPAQTHYALPAVSLLRAPLHRCSTHAALSGLRIAAECSCAGVYGDMSNTSSFLCACAHSAVV